MKEKNMRMHPALVLGLAVGLATATAAVYRASISERERQDLEMNRLRMQMEALATSQSKESDAHHWSLPGSVSVSPAQAMPNQAPAPRSSADAGRGVVASRDAGSSDWSENRREQLETVFYSDNSAPKDWGGQSPREATDRLKGFLPDHSTLQSFDCHAALCRIETSHPDMNRYRSFAQAAFVQGNWNAPFFITREKDAETPGGPLIMVAYIAQPGSTLPAE